MHGQTLLSAAGQCWLPLISDGSDFPVRTQTDLTAELMDESALQERVVAAYEDAREDVYYYALNFGLSSGQAQEVAQEVFLRLFTTLRRGEDISNIRGWVFRVAHNLALKVRGKEREVGGVENTIEWSISPEDSPEKQAIDHQQKQRIAAALAGLSPQQRQCLDLRVAGLRYREIAETLGVGTSTVNEFLRRAITKLKKALDA